MKAFLTIIFFALSINASIAQSSPKYPYYYIIDLKNSSKEMRIFTFTSQVKFFMWCVYGNVKLEDNKTAFFAKDYNIDTAYFKQGIAKIRASLPKNFWGDGVSSTFYDNEPNEAAIWFTRIFVQVDKGEKIKIFSAYKVTFEGTDATIDAQRREPKIKNVEFITDAKAIQALDMQLKKATPVK